MSLPNEEIICDMMEIRDDILKNFERYEISNFAKNDFRCKHNEGYWKIQDYLGIGAGAHGRIHIKNKRYETENFHLPKKWMNNINNSSNGLKIFKTIYKIDQIHEILLMGLRIVDGIDLKDIKNRLNIDLIEHLNSSQFKILVDQKIIIYQDEILRIDKAKLDFVDWIIEVLNI